MSQWKIAYSQDNNTQVLDVDLPAKPDMAEAAELVLKSVLKKGELGEVKLTDVPEDHPEPTIARLEKHAIIITGITQG
ncbi:hypothetical protein [Pseudomonas mangiferae]|uniref:Uncharacterized protein n=1 Tax=Pseudomonas mangiferae TaxID=2593654 RepID=A0A553GWA5_9PSED|nr:hypothetical protein [Pseudomonas mangiferae]TRX73755.1 hypothetical protein FM069_16640 [Pseudomonas mangiferae]